MKQFFLLFIVFSLLAAPISASEVPANLENYVARSEAIAICVVEKDNGDGTVTASITEVLKGSLKETEVIRGETGHCVMRGSVSRFMKPQKKYLVFLFQDNKVGRLGGILEIGEDKTLLINYIVGFTDTDFNKESHQHTLPINKAKDQIKDLLQKPTK